MADFKPGDRITVQVGERFFETEIDNHGVQRFITDPIMEAWVDGTTQANDAYNQTHPDWSKRDAKFFTLNELSLMYHNGAFTQNQWLDFYTSIGYSVAGFADISFFSDMEILNPLWGDTVTLPQTITAEEANEIIDRLIADNNDEEILKLASLLKNQLKATIEKA